MSTYQYQVIPGAGTYLEQQSLAQQAYEKARLNLETQRRQQQTTSGMNESWQVNPQAQYGAYQQMLQDQGYNLDLAGEEAQSRGLFGSGLGNQNEGRLRYGQAVEQLGFKNQLANWEQQYQGGMADAQQNLNQALLQALQNARDRAAESGDFNVGDPYGGGGDGGGAQEPTYPDEFIGYTDPINLGMELPPGFNIPPIEVRPGTKPIKLSPTFMKPKAKPATRANPYSGNPAHRLPVKKTAPPKKAPSKTSGNPMHRPTPVKKAAPSTPRRRK